MYTLTFDYICEYAGDTVQFAYSIPYTYTKLSEFLHRLLQSESTISSYLRKIISKDVKAMQHIREFIGATHYHQLN